MGRDQRLKARRRAAKGQEPCVYCGVNPGLTADHVPPKGLFPEPRPSNLITVPCCEACRTEQNDDEYFKNMIVLRRDVSTNPLGRRLVESVEKALTRPESRPFTTNLLRSVQLVEIRTLAGLYLGRAATYTADTRRLDRVMRRTLLGLYFHETQTRLPDSHDAKVFSLAAFPELDSDQQAILQRTVTLGMSGKLRALGDGVFVYAFQGIQRPALHRVVVLGVHPRPLHRLHWTARGSSMIAAIYARNSTESTASAMTRSRSHGRLTMPARSRRRGGWTVADEHVYADDGITGAEFDARPGLRRLLAALKPRPPFQALVMSEGRAARARDDRDGFRVEAARAGRGPGVLLSD
jgi:hypothetical protein